MPLVMGQAQVRRRKISAWQDCGAKGSHKSPITVFAELEHRLCFYIQKEACGFVVVVLSIRHQESIYSIAFWS